MLLVADIGNTNALFGVFSGEDTPMTCSIRAATQKDRMPDEWLAILQPVLAHEGIAINAITDCVISSVVPSVTRWLIEMCQNRLQIEPVIVSMDLDLGIGVDVDFPREVGADRLVNAMAAVERYGAPVISIDFGTALNFDVVDANRNFVGGAFAPGLVIALDALTARAARLYSVDLVPPPCVIGRNTTESMQSGLVLGYISLVEGMIRRIRDQLGAPAPVVITGGYAELIADHSLMVDHHDPDLTVEGLRTVWQRNRH